MDIIAKTQEGREYLRSTRYSILCKNETQAKSLAEHLNRHNKTACGEFKLKDGEKWFAYKIDKYDSQPLYKVKTTKNKISLVYND